ncbi:MAG: hypothetical protein ACE5HB_08165 [Terriglobia bacterium]
MKRWLPWAITGLLIIWAALTVRGCMGLAAAKAEANLHRAAREAAEARVDSLLDERSILEAERDSIDAAAEARSRELERQVSIARARQREHQRAADSLISAVEPLLPDSLRPTVSEAFERQRAVIVALQSQVSALEESNALKDRQLAATRAVEVSLREENAALRSALEASKAEAEVLRKAVDLSLFPRLFKNLDIVVGTAAVTGLTVLVVR